MFPQPRQSLHMLRLLLSIETYIELIWWHLLHICMNLLTNREAHVFIVNLGSYTDILSISIQKKTHLGILVSTKTYKSTRKAHLSLWRAGHSTEQSIENPFILTQTMVVRIPWWSFRRNKFLFIRNEFDHCCHFFFTHAWLRWLWLMRIPPYWRCC